MSAQIVTFPKSKDDAWLVYAIDPETGEEIYIRMVYDFATLDRMNATAMMLGQKIVARPYSSMVRP